MLMIWRFLFTSQWHLYHLCLNYDRIVITRHSNCIFKCSLIPLLPPITPLFRIVLMIQWNGAFWSIAKWKEHIFSDNENHPALIFSHSKTFCYLYGTLELCCWELHRRQCQRNMINGNKIKTIQWYPIHIRYEYRRIEIKTKELRKRLYVLLKILLSNIEFESLVLLWFAVICLFIFIIILNGYLLRSVVFVYIIRIVGLV